MKNTILVNISANPDQLPFGFWVPSKENAITVKYLAGHDNKKVLRVYEIIARFNVELKAEYNAAGELLQDEWNTPNKWVFRLNELCEESQAKAKQQLADVNLYQVQSQIYSNIDI